MSTVDLKPRAERRREHRYLNRMLTRSQKTQLQAIQSWFEYTLGLCEVNEQAFSEEDFFERMKLRFPEETIKIFKKEYDKAMREAKEENE